MSQEERQEFSTAIDSLNFTSSIPTGWIAETVQQATNDFSNAAEMQKLVALHDAKRQFAFMLRARPIAAGTSLKSQASAILDATLLNVYSMDEQELSSEPGVVGLATDETTNDRAPVWFAFLEHNQYLVQLSLRFFGGSAGAHLNAWNTIANSFRFADSAAPAQPSQEPPHVWWARAKQLELENKLGEAEAVIRNAVPHLGAISQTARLYAERMTRLLTDGDIADAREAHGKASDWIRDYASLATSGGEGAALSFERDQFLNELGPVP